MKTIFPASNPSLGDTRPSSAKFCTKCGAPVLEGARFCTKCGAPVYNPVPASAPAPMPASTSTPAPASAPAATPVQQKIPRKLLLAIGGGAAVLLIVVLILVFTLGGGNTLKGDGYVVELPEGVDDIECEFATEEQMAELQSDDYEFISRPLLLTQDGDQHVWLDKMAKVSFDIPKDIPKEEYINLVGVLITEDGPVYMIPEIEGIRQGVVRFETSHFCWAGAAKMDENAMRELFIERICFGQWQANACDKDLEKSMKETIMDFARDCGYGEDAVMGKIAREVLSDNEFIKDAGDLIDAYDEGETAEVIAEKLKEKAKAKMLAMLFEKLKGDKKVDKVEYDELDDKYVHKRITKEGKNKKIVEKLENYLTKEKMEDLGTRLGRGDSPLEIAWDYIKKDAKGFAEEQLKSFSTKMIPQIRLWQKGYKLAKILKECWASNTMIDMYKDYAKECDSNGRMTDDFWRAFSVKRLNAVMSKFGLTEAEIRQQFEECYVNNRALEQEKADLRKWIMLWEHPDYDLVNKPIFDKLHFDYIQRLSRIFILMRRFYDELNVNGDIPGREGQDNVDRTLCKIVAAYLDFYPDQEKFYRWLAWKGHYKGKLQKSVDGLDELRSWWLIRTDIDRTPNVSDGENSTVYSGSATQHQKVERWTGEKFLGIGDVWYCPHTSTFTATIEAPPAWIEGGDSLVLHTTLHLDAPENGWYLMESPSLNFDLEEIGVGFIHRSARKGQVRNLKGSSTVGTRYGSPRSGEWDYVIYIPSGHKDELKALNFFSCGTRTHWVYKWCSVFEKDE